MMNNIIYNVCKRSLSRGEYPLDMELRLKAFLEANLLTEEQYNELMEGVIYA